MSVGISGVLRQPRSNTKYSIENIAGDGVGIDESGGRVTSITDWGAVIDALVALAGANGPCDIKTKEGTYTIPAAGDATVGKLTYLDFAPGVKLDVTGNLTKGCIVIDTANPARSDWSVTGPVEIDLNLNNGAGIYSDNAASSGGYCFSRLGGGMFINAVAATFAGVDLYNAFYMYQLPIWVKTHGVGFRYRRKTYSLHTGNLIIHEPRVTNLGSNDVIGMHIQGSGGYRALNLTEVHRLQDGGTGDDNRTGTVGIRLEDDSDITFYNCDIEGVEKGIHISDCKRMLFYSSFVWSERLAAATRAALLDGDCLGITFSGGILTTDTTGTPYEDATDALGASRHMCLLTGGIEIYPEGWILGNRTRCDKAILWSGTTFRRGYSENSETASITGAVNIKVVTHNLASTPLVVNVTPLQAGFGECWVSNKNGTTFTINFTNQPGGATWYFDWEARITG